MKPLKPKVEVNEDRADKIMAQTGWIAGYSQHVKFPKKTKSKDLVVWCFGFFPGTPQAKAYGVSVNLQLWVLADKQGTTLQSCYGSDVSKLPDIFQKVLQSS